MKIFSYASFLFAGACFLYDNCLYAYADIQLDALGELDWYGQIEYCSSVSGSGLSDYGYDTWYGDVKYDALLYESFRVRNNATYENSSKDHYKNLSENYWDLPSSSGYPRLKDCPFQNTTYN